MTTRHFRRLIRSFQKDGYGGLVSKRRGKKSNRGYSDTLKEHVLGLVREKYHDFGPTLIAEKMIESHNIRVSHETIRAWLIESGIWKTRKERAKRVYQPRYRRECFGELIQIDGSDHHWFEGRGPACTLIVFIDDATGRLMELRFSKSESTFDYFYSTRRHLERYGKPVAFYSDKHSIFRVNQTGAVNGNGMSQFGRAMHELNIDIICANTSQAKGRVERMNKTLQDRLVKELRLAGICDIETANEFLPSFMEDFNAKFTKAPFNPKDMHRALTEMDRLDDIFAWQEERTVTNNLTLQYDRVVYLLAENGLTKGLKRKKVMVYDYPDGNVAIKAGEASLLFSVFDKCRQVKQSDIVNYKRLSAALEWARMRQLQNPVRRSQSAPRRRGQKLILQEVYRKLNPAALAS
jgi:hypothetical protein